MRQVGISRNLTSTRRFILPTKMPVNRVMETLIRCAVNLGGNRQSQSGVCVSYGFVILVTVSCILVVN